MDTTEILSRGMLHGSPGKLIENFYVMVQQAAAQLAAMRGILEAERAYAIALRRRAQPQGTTCCRSGCHEPALEGRKRCATHQREHDATPWPPPNAEPLSHIG